MATATAASVAPSSSATTTPGGSWDLLKVIGLTPSAESNDYVHTKSQFQLHNLVTEQRHPKTWNLSQTIAKSCQVFIHHSSLSLSSMSDDA
jgi:hypothetical protein